MQEHPHKRFQDLSPKAERAWEPSENSATNALPIEPPNKSKEIPQPRPETADISPARERHKVPDRKAAMLKDRQRSLGASLALHLAVGTTWLSLPEPQPNTPDFSRLDDQERLDALGNTIEARLLRMAETDEHNREVRAQLEHERHAYFDRLIETALNPESPEYKARYGIPPIEAFAHIDALTHVEKLIKPYQAQKLDAERVAELVQEYKANLLARHKENMDVLFAHGYEWTGNVRTDFPTLQQALFQGPDRYFYNPGFSETLYQRDHGPLDSQLTTGLVNCQVARMTPIALFDIYERAGLPKDDLAHLRQTAWKDHVFSGYENPSTQEAFTLMEGVFGTPEWPGTHPPSAEEPGALRPPAEHLIAYLRMHDATPEQLARLAHMGYKMESLNTYSSVPIPDDVFDFGSYEKMVASDQRTSDHLERVRQTAMAPVEIDAPTLDFARSEMFYIFDAYTKAHPVGGTSSQAVSIVTIPSWVRSDTARAYLPQYMTLGYDQDAKAAVHRAFMLDGARSRDVLERTREHLVERLQQQMSVVHDTQTDVNVQRGMRLLRPYWLPESFAPSVVYAFHNEPWFFPAMDAAIEARVQGLADMSREGFQSQGWTEEDRKREIITSLRYAASFVSQLDSLAEQETRSSAHPAPHLYTQRARRLEQALVPYQAQGQLDSFTSRQIATMPESKLRDVIARSKLSLALDPPACVRGAYIDRLVNNPDLYVATLELLSQHPPSSSFDNLLVRDDARRLLRLSETASHNARLKRRLEAAVRRIIQSQLEYLENPNLNDPEMLSALLALHEECAWLRPLIEEQLRQIHAARPFTSFDIDYANLQRFGIEPSAPFPPSTTAGLLPLFTALATTYAQFHHERNGEIDSRFRDAYLASDNQDERLLLLWYFFDRTSLPPPVKKEQLLPEDLAFLEGPVDTVATLEDDIMWWSKIKDLKAFYAPQTIDMVRDFYQRSPDFNLYDYRRWAEINPDIGLQFVGQWLAFEQTLETSTTP